MTNGSPEPDPDPDPDPPLTPPALIPVELGILFTTVFFWFILAEACGPVRGCMY